MTTSDKSSLVKANLGLRLLLELTAAVGYPLAFAVGMDGGIKWVFAVGSAIGFWVIWAVFATADDPSRSGKTVVPTPGPIRLILELALFFGAAALLAWAGIAWLGIALAVGTIVHYALWPHRIRWLLSR